MKTLAALVIVVGYAGRAASDVAVAPVNATAPRVQKEAISVRAINYCSPKPEGLYTWYYNSKSEGPYKCTTNHDTHEWSMYNAYRSGGTQGVHWKYTNDQNDGECLKDWKYYSSDGQNLITTVSGRTTTQGDSRRWCALPVYRPGGVQGKQWDRCDCERDTRPPTRS